MICVDRSDTLDALLIGTQTQGKASGSDLLPAEEQILDLSVKYDNNQRRTWNARQEITMCLTWEEKAKWNQIFQSISSAFDQVGINGQYDS